MKTKLIKLIVIITAAACSFITPTVSPVFAEETSDCTNMCSPSCKVPDEIKAASGCNTVGETGELNDTVIRILNSIIGALGLIAVVLIIIGGIGYMTSAGDATKLKKAKDTILYACIGLAICALAFAIVNFAIGIINGPETP